MNKIKILIKKEILDVMRDKKTLIMMLVIPVLLYPLMILGITFVMNSVISGQMTKSHPVAYSSFCENEASKLISVYNENKNNLEAEIDFISMDPSEKESKKDSYDVWIDFSRESNGIVNINAEYTSSNTDSSATEAILKEVINLYKENLISENLKNEGLDKNFLNPVSYTQTDNATAAESAGMSIGGSIAMMLIMTILTGAFYPAIDSVTGEKERGTLETLLTLPVTNFEMIISKFITVALFACTTSVISLTSLSATMFIMAGGMGLNDKLNPSSFISYLPIILVTVLSAALLITALCMAFCIFAKSYKEANNYFTPVMIIVMFGSMAGMIPTIELNEKTALIPIVNTALLIKSVISQNCSIALAGVATLINLSCSFVGAWLLTKMYDSENILFTDGFQSFKIFDKRSEIKKGTVPKNGDLVLVGILYILINFYLGLALGTKISFLLSAFIVQLIILTIPLITVWYMKSDVKKLFYLNMPKLKDIFGGILLYTGTFFIITLLSALLSPLMPESTKNVEETFSTFLEYPFITVLLVVSLMPAIGEELLFRGLICGSLKTRYKTAAAVVISALLFGAAHMSLIKLPITALIGACFAYIMIKSGSIFIGMVLHFLNNAFSMTVMFYPSAVKKIAPILFAETFTAKEIFLYCLTGCIAALLGIFILNKNKKADKKSVSA